MEILKVCDTHLSLHSPSRFSFQVLGFANMAQPFKLKLEEQKALLAAGNDPPAKRPCSAFEKKIGKMASGDLTHVRDQPVIKTISGWGDILYIYIYVLIIYDMMFGGIIKYFHMGIMKYVPALNQDIVDYVMSFRKEDVSDSTAHPAQIVVDMLGAQDEESRKLHCAQIEAWYQEYATSRGLVNLFKKPGFAPYHKWSHMVVSFANM